MKTRTVVLASAAVSAFFGLSLIVYGAAESDLLALIAPDLGATLVGWASFADLLRAAFVALSHDALVDSFRLTHVIGRFAGGWGALTEGLGLWVLACALVAWAYRGSVVTEPASSSTITAPLNPRLASFVDFHWGTLTAYGFGVLLAEIGFMVSYTLLVGKGTVQGGVATSGLSPVWAFTVAFFIALSVAFAGGFLGSANSKRLSTPEATIALVYFGLPIPVLFSMLHSNSWLMVNVGYRVRELVYLSSLLGENRPEMGYWLITAALAVALFLGINFGFVSTSTGRLDLRGSYEFFIASRHVSVFRFELIVGVFAVLFFIVVPPLLVWGIVNAAQAVVERTRIRKLGLKDPLAAAAALNDLKARAQTPTAMMTSLSVLGVGVGVMALIIVLSVMSGFEADLQKKILGTNAHGMVLTYSQEMPDYHEVLGKVRSVRGIAGATPFILNEVMVSSEANVSGSMIKGIDPSTVGSVTDLPEYLLPGGKLDWLVHPEEISAKKLTPLGDGVFDERPATGGRDNKDNKAPHDDDIARDPLVDLPAKKEDVKSLLPGIIIGRELAASLKVIVGDRVNVVSPLGGDLGPQGPMPKSRAFRVAGLFYSGMYEYDAKFVYIDLREAETFFNVKGATGIEVKVTDVDNARGTMKAVYDTLEGYPYRTKDWGEMNRNLFAALRLEKLVMGIILSIIVIVAAGLIVATVIMLVLEKRKEIAVLKALGVPDGGIVKIFLMAGLQIGVVGGLLGMVVGLLWCSLIERFGIKLDPQVYYIPALPVRVEPFQTVLSLVIAILVTFLASIYPALKAAQVEPVDGLKSE